MTTLQIEAQFSTENLLKAVGKLNTEELDEFATQVLALRARHRAPSLPKEEAELLIKINEGLPFRTQKRYDELIAKRRSETLSSEEYEELLQLTEQSERLQANRIEYLSILAEIRHIPLTKLMNQLGIKPAYD